jgi:hypothetical protein
MITLKIQKNSDEFWNNVTWKINFIPDLKNNKNEKKGLFIITVVELKSSQLQ